MYQIASNNMMGLSQIYGKNADCTWLVTAVTGDFIVITVSMLYLETNRDFFIIGNGHNVSSSSEVLRLTGIGSFSSVTFNSTTIWMRFITDWKVAWLGYHMGLRSSSQYGN